MLIIIQQIHHYRNNRELKDAAFYKSILKFVFKRLNIISAIENAGMKKKVSMKDIAQHLDVSIALVSYVLNNQLEGRINKDTAEKIRTTAAELGYRTNQIAKSLKNSRTQTIGLIVTDISSPFAAQLARIIEDEAKKNKYTVIFGSSDESFQKSEELIHAFMSRQVDGFIIVPAERSEKQLSLLKKQDVPFVLVDRFFPGFPANSVTIDNFQASYDAVTHLLKNGFKRIGMINLKTTLFHSTERSRGYKYAMEDEGADSESYFREINGKNLEAEVQQTIDDLLNLPEPADALFFGNNNIAMAGLAQIRNLKLTVPNDLAIVCFDEAAAYNLFSCSLTHIKQPLTNIGQSAVKLLIEAINEDQQVTKSITMEAELVIHQSSLRKS